MVRFKKPYLKVGKKKKIAMMKAMKFSGIPRKIIAEKMGVNPKTVSAYTKIELDGEWLEFENAIRKIYMEQDFDMMQMMYKNLKEKMPKATFRDIAEFFKTVRTVNAPKTPTPSLNQTNIKFEITDGTKNPEIIKGEEVEK